MCDGPVARSLREILVATFDDPDYTPPPLPSVAFKLADLALHDDVHIDDIVRLLEQDQVLAGLVLRIVSCPLYASKARVTTLHQAVMRVGLKTLRNIVFEAALRRGLFNLPEYRETAEQVLRHSTTTAYIAKIVSASCGVDPESGFLCGLLHDIGFSALLLSVSSLPRDMVPRLDDLWPDLDTLHEWASSVVLRLWKLPEDICDIVGSHHHVVVRDGEVGRIAAAVCVADWLTERFGANVVASRDAEGRFAPADAMSASSLEAATTLLRLDDERLQSILEKAEEVVPDVLWV
jgi:HD-like signal output (HDOD) protein